MKFIISKKPRKLHMDLAEELAEWVCTRIAEKLPSAYIAPVGEVRRKCPIVSQVEVLIGYNGEVTAIFDEEQMALVEEDGKRFVVKLEGGVSVIIHQCLAEEFGSKVFLLTGSAAFVKAFAEQHTGMEFRGLRMEDDVFDKANIGFLFRNFGKRMAKSRFPAHNSLINKT